MNLKEAGGQWHWEKLAITSSWGWTATQYETVLEPIGLQHFPFGGHPVAYVP